MSGKLRSAVENEIREKVGPNFTDQLLTNELVNKLAGLNYAIHQGKTGQMGTPVKNYLREKLGITTITELEREFIGLVRELQVETPREVLEKYADGGDLLKLYKINERDSSSSANKEK